MKTKGFTLSPYFNIYFIALLFLFIGSGSMLAAQEGAKTAAGSGLSGGDVFEFIIIAGYLIGVFVLLPWVIYTNMKEKLAVIDAGSSADTLPDPNLSEDERNRRAAMILEEIENKLTPFQEEGEELRTITKGSQARFIKKGIEYIRQNLKPTDPEIISRANEIIEVYNDRTKRVFTGSKWVIGAAVGIGLIFLYQMGIKAFLFIHFLGVAFYILSSRTPVYILEKRIKLFGKFGGAVIGSIFSGLFAGADTKHYKVYQDGRKERDHESELTGGLVYFFIIVVVAMILGFLAAALGVL
ncbi:MAG: hypothetical protein GXO77_16660 [Calditrichaeota bacterium]|nr:hypothetical protein [Calditrichota bacterium]